MTQNAKVAVAVAVVLVLAAGAYYWQQHTMTEREAGDFTTASTTLPSGDSTTDTSLQQDAAAIDAELKGLSADQASVDSSVEESSKLY